MELMNNIEIKGPGIFLKQSNSLVLSDFHIGYEEELNKKGLFIPRFSFEDIKNKLSEILTKDFDKIIINGDLKHEFGTISRQEWNETLKILEYLSKFTKEIILIKGNHDTILEPLVGKINLNVKDHLIINKTLIIHGDKKPSKDLLKKVDLIIIGHEHPAISLKENFRVEKFKIFLKGKYEDKDLIVMPSVNPIFIGTDVKKERLLSPLLKNIKDFEVYLLHDDIYEFGKIKDLKFV
jgi:uncharacterized protein